MTSDDFDRRTRANMEVALERMCVKFPDALAGHEARKIIAAEILRRAAAGEKTLGQLTAAASAAAVKLGLGQRSRSAVGRGRAQRS